MNLDFFRKDRWIGEGLISVEGEDDSFPIVMKIKMKDFGERSPIFEFTSCIHMDESEDIIENCYTLTMHRKKKFHVLIAGENWGHVEGDGFIKDDFIGWEVTSPDGIFHGYESIEVKKGGELLFHGEYAAKNEMRTKITAKLASYENIIS